MTANSIGKVSLNGLFAEDFQYTFLAASGITADNVGAAVTIDSSAANQIKLAGDSDQILGRLEVVEVRVAEGITLATISTKGAYQFNVNPNATASSPDETPAVGDYLLGATNNASVKGFVQKASTGNTVVTRVLVVEVLNSGAQVVAIVL